MLGVLYAVGVKLSCQYFLLKRDILDSIVKKMYICDVYDIA